MCKLKCPALYQVPLDLYQVWVLPNFKIIVTSHSRLFHHLKKQPTTVKLLPKFGVETHFFKSGKHL